MVVFDKLEAPAPIGSGLILQPVGLRVLDEIGAGAAMRALGAPILRLSGKSEPSGRVVLDVRYRALGELAPAGLGVHRGALFRALFEAARAAGAEIEAGREVVGAEEGALLFADGRRSARFDLVIDALGVRSPLSGPPAQNLPYGALWASLDWVPGFSLHALEQRYQAASKMAGVLPIGRLDAAGRPLAAYFWSLKHAAFPRWRDDGLEAWKQEARALWPATAPLLDQITTPDQLVFASYAHRTLRTPIAHKLARVGDSWHCTSPQLGQGANMALLDALALARALVRQDDLEVALSEYARLRLWHIRLYQAASWLFTPAYQSDGKAVVWLRDALAAPLSKIPPGPQVLAALVAGVWGAPLGAMGVRG